MSRVIPQADPMGNGRINILGDKGSAFINNQKMDTIVMTTKSTPTEHAVEKFARDVVIHSLEDSVFEMERDLNSYFNDANNSVLSSLLANKPDLEKMKIISSLAAELALATFFSNLDLDPNFGIKIEGEEDEWYDLADAYEIPVICAFQDDGWVSQYSKLPSYLNQVDQQREDTSKSQGA